MTTRLTAWREVQPGHKTITDILEVESIFNPSGSVRKAVRDHLRDWIERGREVTIETAPRR